MAQRRAYLNAAGRWKSWGGCMCLSVCIYWLRKWCDGWEGREGGVIERELHSWQRTFAKGMNERVCVSVKLRFCHEVLLDPAS
jgi:hypothetical protein